SATSELSRLNAPAPGTTTVSPDMAARLARSLTLSAESDGAFDVRLGPLTAIWRRPSPPSEPEVDGARAGSRPNAVRGRAGRVRLGAGARLDFDGIAKGWAVDACAARLRDAGVTSALVSLGGGSLFALGAPARASRWRLAVRGPDPDTTVGWLGLRDAGASVSATYGSDGKRAGHVAHVLDPSTGRPPPAAAGARRRGTRARGAARAGGGRGAAAMRVFGSSSYLLSDARLEVRLVYSGFLLLAMIGLATMALMQLKHIGPTPAAIATYFRGGER